MSTDARPTKVQVELAIKEGVYKSRQWQKNKPKCFGNADTVPSCSKKTCPAYYPWCIKKVQG